MKKSFLIILALTLALLLCACGKTEQPALEAAPAAEPAAAQTPEPMAEPNAEPTPESTPEPTPEPTPVPLSIVELDAESTITREGDYVLNNMFSEVQSDRLTAEGWYYYYSVGMEDGTPWLRWETAPGKYTQCEVIFNLQNLGADQTETYMQRIKGFFLYNLDLSAVPECADASEYLEALRALASAAPEAELCELTPLQENPDQLDSDGYPALSKDAKLLTSGASARQLLRTDISESFYRSWENSESAEPMWAVFSLDEDTVYLVNLRTQMRDDYGES